LLADEDTKLSAEQVAKALQQKGAEVELLPIDIHNVEAKLSHLEADCLFNIIDWTGKDLPYALFAYEFIEQSGLPYTGANTANFDMVADKTLMKHAFDRFHIPTARWQAFQAGDEKVRDDFSYPVIVKPSLQHCSIGLSRDMVVSNAQQLQQQVKIQLKKFGPVFAEEFIVGREFQVTVIEEEGKPRVLPPIEITFAEQGERAFLTYEARWEPDHPDYQLSDIGLPKVSDPELNARIEKICREIYTNMDYRDYMRVDMRVRGTGKDAEIFVLEANCNPGLGDDNESAIPLAYRAVGLNFADFIWEIVKSSMRRFGKSITM
jgi:D-alanine-D-alanine ligase